MLPATAQLPVIDDDGIVPPLAQMQVISLTVTGSASIQEEHCISVAKAIVHLDGGENSRSRSPYIRHPHS